VATLVVDGSYVLHRVMHVPQLRQLCNKDKKPSGGVFGVTKSLRATIAQWSEINRAVFVFDGGRSKRRMELYPEYKKRDPHDEVDPDGMSYIDKFRSQVRLLKFILPRMGVKVVQAMGYEADDLIGHLCKTLDDQLILVSSDDRDMYQLVSPTVHIWRPMAEERVMLENFQDVAGAKNREYWLLRKAILGDGSDNIPGVHGIGEKTADEVVSSCEDIGAPPHDKFFEYVAAVGSKRAQKIVAGKDIVLRNLELVDISREVIPSVVTEEIKATIATPNEFDILTVKRMFVSLEFYSLIDDFGKWITQFQLLR